jgi:hypothetical protein
MNGILGLLTMVFQPHGVHETFEGFARRPIQEIKGQTKDEFLRTIKFYLEGHVVCFYSEVRNGWRRTEAT